MRLSVFAVPAIAILADAAAVAAPEAAAAKSSAVDQPVTLSNRSAAVASVLSSMSSQYSRDHPQTSSVATTTKVSGGKKTSAAAGPKKTSTSATTKKVGSTSSKKGSASAKATGSPKASGSAKVTSASTEIQATTTAGAAAKATTSASTTSKSVKASKVRRQNVNSACAAQPILYTYTPAAPASTDVIAPLSAFLKDDKLASDASAVATIPGFTSIYSGLLGIAQKPLYYMFYTDMSSYNATACGEICTNTQGCRSFNMYYERSPTLAPASGCPNPSAYTAIRCAFYSTFLKSTDVVNSGQWRKDFGVVVTGSNAYRKVF
ncbi:hypothetical protein C1H76_6181 [Elsinoe australis]|uniref:Uncharacterized protein n=1 Tax=Elsinoe australis TaxID=40998 RepID=A0A4U7AWT8_9PEZI|nr:hypothetical protein C1H76_6181 [Elsinoe australis]